MAWLAHSGRSKLDGAPVGSGRYPLGSGEDPFQGMTSRQIQKARGKLDRADNKWAKRNYKRIMSSAEKASRSEMRDYDRQLRKVVNKYNKDGKISANYAIAYNRKLAQLMTEKVSDLSSPSGKVVSFVANRGRIGVSMALSDAGYDTSQLKNGIYGSGKIAYRKKNVDVMSI